MVLEFTLGCVPRNYDIASSSFANSCNWTSFVDAFQRARARDLHHICLRSFGRYKCLRDQTRHLRQICHIFARKCLLLLVGDGVIPLQIWPGQEMVSTRSSGVVARLGLMNGSEIQNHDPRLPSLIYRKANEAAEKPRSPNDREKGRRRKSVWKPGNRERTLFRNRNNKCISRTLSELLFCLVLFPPSFFRHEKHVLMDEMFTVVQSKAKEKRRKLASGSVIKQTFAPRVPTSSFHYLLQFTMFILAVTPFGDKTIVTLKLTSILRLKA